MLAAGMDVCLYISALLCISPYRQYNRVADYESCLTVFIINPVFRCFYIFKYTYIWNKILCAGHLPCIHRKAQEENFIQKLVAED